VSAHLKPLQGRPLTFWHVGGDIIWRGPDGCEPISRLQAEMLREEFSQLARAFYRAGAMETSVRFATLWLELTRALDAQDTWRRVVESEPLRPIGGVVADIIDGWSGQVRP
jgi:hypothetical protein